MSRYVSVHGFIPIQSFCQCESERFQLLCCYTPGMKIAIRLALGLLLQAAAWAQAQAPQATQPTVQPFLEINGDVPHPRVFQEKEWVALKHSSLSATNNHEKKTSTYSGVALRDLLQAAGLPSGENLRGKALATCIVVTATDGYQVAFSIGELDESIGGEAALLADREDDKPLGANVGPLRLVVPGDKRPTRWVRMVRTIRVIGNPTGETSR